MLFAESKDDKYDLFTEQTSDNFVIRWAFQAVCDHCLIHVKYGRHQPNPTERLLILMRCMPGQMIFVRDAPYFFKHMHPKIKVPYFILTHGEYLDTFQESYFKYANEKNVFAWFTIHPPEEKHEKVFPLAFRDCAIF